MRTHGDKTHFECHTLPSIFQADTQFSVAEVFHSVEHWKSKGVGKYVLHHNAYLDIVELQLRTKGVFLGNTSLRRTSTAGLQDVNLWNDV